MNVDTARQLRSMLANTEWLGRASAFARSLRTARHGPGGLLIVGTPEHEPWHFAAHLDDAARLSGHRELAPTLVRHQVPAGAPAHLAVDLSRLHSAARGETVLVVARTNATDDLLNRIDDARRAGVTILAIDAGDDDLHDLAHDALTVDGQLIRSTADGAFDATEHLVTLDATEPPRISGGWASRLRRHRPQ